MAEATTSPTSRDLHIRGLNAWYGESHVLHGVDIAVREGEVVTLLGRNGAGKTTTLRAIMGLVDRRVGSIRHGGVELTSLPLHRIAHQGLGYCPEERGIFATLTVEENLSLLPVVKPNGMPVAEILQLFPNLTNRGSSGGTKLSGGEQQMLAIGRILRTGARFLLLDEPTEGLAPVIVQAIAAAIRLLKTKGYTILLVEQNLRFASSIADRHYVLQGGRVIETMSNAELGHDPDRLRRALTL